MSIKITEISYIQLAKAPDEAAGCKRAVWIADPHKRGIAGDERAEKTTRAAMVLEDLAGEVLAHILVGDIEPAPSEDEAPWSLQAAAAGRHKGADSGVFSEYFAVAAIGHPAVAGDVD